MNHRKKTRIEQEKEELKRILNRVSEKISESGSLYGTGMLSLRDLSIFQIVGNMSKIKKGKKSGSIVIVDLDKAVRAVKKAGFVILKEEELV